MSVELTVIGCSGSFAGPGNPASSYVVSGPGAGGERVRILVDCGSGALMNLQRVMDPASIDAIVISHLHADHFIDLAGLEVFLAYHPRQACPTLPIYAPQGLEERLSAATGNWDPIPPGASRAPFEFRTLSDGARVRVGGVEIVARAVRHPVEAYGFRFEADGAVLAYSGDTDCCEGVEDLAAGADVFLCEAGYIEGRDDHFTGVHLTGERAARIASRAGVGRLVLTHIPPWTEPEVPLREARAHFRGEVTLAQPLDTYTLGATGDGSDRTGAHA